MGFNQATGSTAPLSPAQRIEALKAKLEQGRSDKMRAEAQLEQLAQESTRITGELAELGSSPDTVDADLARYDSDIAALLGQAEAALAG